MAQSNPQTSQHMSSGTPLDVTVDGTTYSESAQETRLRARNTGDGERVTCVDCGAIEPLYGNANPHGIEKHHLIQRVDWLTEAESHRLRNMVFLCKPCHRDRWQQVHPHVQLRAFQSVVGGMLDFWHAGERWLDAKQQALQAAGWACENENCSVSAEQVKYEVFPGSSDLTYEGLNLSPYLHTHVPPSTIRFYVSFDVRDASVIFDSLNNPSRMTVLCDRCYYGEDAPFTGVTSPDQGGVEQVAPHLL